MSPMPTPHSIRIAALAVVPIALLTTYFRLYLRIKKRIPWWDDFWAFVSSIGMLVFFTGMLIFTDPPDAHTRSVKIAGYYMVDNGFYGVIWPARISILLTVMRLAYGRLRLFLKYLVGAFIVTYLILVAQVFWRCEGYSSWKEEASPQCMLGMDVAIAQLITDVFSDILLILAPTYLLHNMNNHKSIKIRLIAIFSTTILTTFTSLLHAYAILKDLGLLEFALCVVELSTSLVVVNLTVVVTWAYNLKDEGSEHSGDQHVNTFFRGRFSGNNSSNEANTTFALAAFGRTNGIEVTVDTVRAQESVSDFKKLNQMKMIEEGTPPNELEPEERKRKSAITWSIVQEYP